MRIPTGGVLMRKESKTQTIDPSEIASVKYLASGGYHHVFIIQFNTKSKMAYRVSKAKFNGKIGRFNFPKFTQETTGSPNIDRTIRLWKEVNKQQPVSKYIDGILVPYFDQKVWREPNDIEMALILDKIYSNTRRILMDIFSDNVRIKREANKNNLKDTDYVVLDPDLLALFSNKKDDDGYESDETSDFDNYPWWKYFHDCMDLYPKTMKKMVWLLHSENKLSMINTVIQIKKIDVYWDQERYTKCLNLVAELNRRNLVTIETDYIDLCCKKKVCPYLYLSTISLLLDSSDLTFPMLKCFFYEVLKRIWSANMQASAPAEDIIQECSLILPKISKIPLNESQKVTLYFMICSYFSTMTNTEVLRIKSFFNQSLMQDLQFWENLKETLLKVSFLKRYNHTTDQQPDQALKILCQYLFVKRHSASTWGLYGQQKTGYQSWQDTENLFGISRRESRWVTNSEQLEHLITENAYRKFHKEIPSMSAIGN